ncbi:MULTISPECIES: energy-coupling factor ABC transporter substrate-binding protein [Methanobacterium]|jgi:cobalt/nickel transport protein|uniref:Cobalt transport protein CbiN n=1 Tax=Methanobacterium subterraneum TaxID=59277 RepID=A0A2H4VEX3_9EURY|nr:MULTISPECIES: energy-coupling factor ABC transporter substrate-binding protein [Methanobacterium]AUB56643.1 cobalt ABC transporter substrate-binding protein CbiN [Methanobacterium subterraneum]AUB58499.1 cobalt ABC transporter substrate-binding protein CbiN [Methanobacterium sp. MZ-A1]AUB59483.1 cobalt ABC transporter substrate-binding protein CbiN [Methanobacterium subterraneum]MCC7560625.1 energy-coupling factor ABC transporter substrate-binding protein [Methanobacterium sp.]NMO09917.1 en
MDSKYYIVLLALVAIIAILPLAMYSGMGEDEGYFGGADTSAGTVVEETGYEPWFNSFWEPPSGEIESLLFALQAAIGAIIIGYILGYFQGQAKERKRIEKEIKAESKSDLKHEN